jgi:hypothetical protein
VEAGRGGAWKRYHTRDSVKPLGPRSYTGDVWQNGVPQVARNSCLLVRRSHAVLGSVIPDVSGGREVLTDPSAGAPHLQT